MNKIFVGNLAWEVGAEDLKELFSQFGEITDSFVATDKYSGRSRGFGFVTFADDAAAEQAKTLHEQEFKGRDLVVDIAQARDNG